jgi:hypothetical protein
MRRQLPAAFAVALLGALALLATPASADHNNQGTIKVHDDMVAGPPTRNEPHVSCDFWIEGFNMAHATGTLTFTGWPPTGNKTVVLSATWAGTPEEDGSGFHFLAGPFTLDAGHFRVEAFVQEGHPSHALHFAKAKVFWVEPCGEPPLTECPGSIAATANPDGSITVTWTAAAGSDGTNVYRAVGEGDFEYLATVEGTTYHDTNTTAGVTYTYTVTALFGERESTGCQVATVTAIPDFPTPIAAAVAVSAGVIAYAGIVAARRRK